MNDFDEPQHLGGEAQPQSLRSPILGRGGQHRRQHQQDENVSIIQLDYTFTHDPHQPPQRSGKPHTYTILTAIESMTGLCTAVLTSKKGYAPSSSATTSLDSEARLYEEHLTIRCRNIIDAVGQQSLQTSTFLQESHLLTHIRV